VKKYSSQTALAMELPFTICGRGAAPAAGWDICWIIAAHEIDFHALILGGLGFCRRIEKKFCDD